MTDLMTQAAWMLTAGFVLSFVYELYRATVKRGTSRHDSMQAFAKNNLAFYAIAAVLIALLFTGFGWVSWLAAGFCVASIVASIVYYNPKILMERVPGLIGWFEDIAFTGLLFVAGTLLLYDIAGVTLG